MIQTIQETCLAFLLILVLLISLQGQVDGANDVLLPATSPLVGMKRTHTLPDMFKNAKNEKEKQNTQMKKQHKKYPKQLISAVLPVDRPQTSLEPRPPSTPSPRGKDR